MNHTLITVVSIFETLHAENMSNIITHTAFQLYIMVGGETLRVHTVVPIKCRPDEY